jgi:hypothetical protein
MLLLSLARASVVQQQAHALTAPALTLAPQRPGNLQSPGCPATAPPALLAAAALLSALTLTAASHQLPAETHTHT